MALVSKTFSQIITFTRASTATYFDSAGVLQSAAIDVPRFDYNPATLAARGFLIEEARTNLLLQSQFVSGWAASAGTLTTNVTASPDGTTNAASYIEDSANALRSIFQSSQLFTAGATLTASLFVKQTGGATRHFRIQISSNTGANGFRAYFNLATNSVATQTSGFGTGTAVANSATITPVGNGWYRISASGTVDPAATTASSMGFMQDTPSGGAVYTGDGTSGLYIWGAQIEVGAFPTSYIPTTTTALTRSADVAAVNTLSPWYRADKGTLFAEFSSYASGSRAIVGITDGTLNNRIQFFANAGDPYTIASRLVSGGTQTNPANTGSIAVGAIGKAALAYAVGTNQGAMSVNGGAPTTSSPAAIAVGVNTLELGKGSALATMSGHLRRVTYYPRNLSSAELQAITA